MNDRKTREVKPLDYTPGVPPRFVTVADLATDTRTLASMLPSDVEAIVGISRSGLSVAPMLAMLLHRPLYIYRPGEADLINASNGWRLSGSDRQPGRAIIVDDTVMSGLSLTAASKCVRDTFPKYSTAAIYVNPNARTHPDFFVTELPHPHILEWNLFNSVFSQSYATDFDGILCQDCTVAQDDDGPLYEDFVNNVRPLYLMRRAIIPMIVTARMEKYRPQTEAWLAKWGVRYHELVMGPWASLSERRQTDIASYKAEHYRRFLSTYAHHIKPPMFIESDPRQAKRIAALTKALVVCPQAGECYVG